LAASQSQTVTTVRIAPKIYQGQPPTFDSHYSTVLLLRRVFPWFDRSEASSRANKYNFIASTVTPFAHDRN